MKTLKIWFTHFWPTFDKFDNLFIYALSQNYNVVVTPDNPSLVFTDESRFRYQNAKMIYYSGEPFFDIGICDYALTQYEVNDNRFYRIPLYLIYLYGYYKNGIIPSFNTFIKKNEKKTKFCNYIFKGEGQSSIRDRFYRKLIQYKSIDCPGLHHNNMCFVPGEPGTIDGSIEKIKFIAPYKFTIAIENSASYKENFGYTSEKIIEPFIAGSVPIYWGNRNIDKDFNTKTFLNWHDYGSDEKLIDKIIELDNDDNLYNEYLQQSFINLQNKHLFEIDYLTDILEYILGN